MLQRVGQEERELPIGQALVATGFSGKLYSDMKDFAPPAHAQAGGETGPKKELSRR